LVVVINGLTRRPCGHAACRTRHLASKPRFSLRNRAPL